MNKKQILPGIIVKLLLLIFLTFFLAPIIWMLISSLQPQENLMRQDYIFTWDQCSVNYVELFKNPKFLNALKNTVIISTVSTALTILFASFAAYIFARFIFPGKSALIFTVYSIQMGPAVAYLIPLFFIFQKLSLIDNIWAMILAITTFTIPMSMWIMMGFFRAIPKEMEEAGAIDGCTRLQSFFRIVLPLAKPGIISACLVTFISVWGELLLAMPLTLTKATPLTVFASSFSGIQSTNFGGAAAVSMVSIIPIIVIVIIFKDYLLRGLAEGAVKG